jgi:hypothetical protein
MKTDMTIAQTVSTCSDLAKKGKKPKIEAYLEKHDQSVHSPSYETPLLACYLHQAIHDLTDEQDNLVVRADTILISDIQKLDLHNQLIMLEGRMFYLQRLIDGILSESLMLKEIEPFTEYVFLEGWSFCGVLQTQTSFTDEDEDFQIAGERKIDDGESKNMIH